MKRRVFPGKGHQPETFDLVLCNHSTWQLQDCTVSTSLRQANEVFAPKFQLSKSKSLVTQRHKVQAGLCIGKSKNGNLSAPLVLRATRRRVPDSISHDSLPSLLRKRFSTASKVSDQGFSPKTFVRRQIRLQDSYRIQRPTILTQSSASRRDFNFVIS
jgi:hypothetical protein